MKDDDHDETTDAGEEVVEAQTADDLQQNDVCEMCLVAAWSKLNNSNSCKTPALSHGKPDGVAVVLNIRLDG